jgi:glutathione S-transferase
MYRLYDYLPSGNGYKVRLVMHELRLAYELVELDIKQGETRTPAFLALNPNGRIPLLAVPGLGHLAESHAIISFLARDSHLVPAAPWQAAQMWQWMCFEQYNLEPNIGTARFWLKILGRTPAELGEALTDRLERGRAALAVLDQGLAGRPFLLGEEFSLADIALYAYTHVAPDAGIPLADYPLIEDWIRRIEARSPWVPITAR